MPAAATTSRPKRLAFPSPELDGALATRRLWQLAQGLSSEIEFCLKRGRDNGAARIVGIFDLCGRLAAVVVAVDEAADGVDEVLTLVKLPRRMACWSMRSSSIWRLLSRPAHSSREPAAASSPSCDLCRVAELRMHQPRRAAPCRHNRRGG